MTIGTGYCLLIFLNSHLMPTNATNKDLVLFQLTGISSKIVILQAIMTLITGIILQTLKAF